MTIKELTEIGCFRSVHIGSDPSRHIESVFCCDLLSIAMGRAPSGCAWVTVMGNINTLAVAALADAACIILAEDIRLDDIALAKAIQQDITVFCTEAPVLEAALAVHQHLNHA